MIGNIEEGDDPPLLSSYGWANNKIDIRPGQQEKKQFNMEHRRLYVELANFLCSFMLFLEKQ